MRLISNLFFYKLASFALFTLLLMAFGAHADQPALMTKSGIIVPEGSRGVVHLRNAKMGTLLHLRGLAGSGKVILRSDTPGRCLQAPVDLVAGDFGGNQIGIRSTGPIQLALYSERVVNAVRRGDEIASDDFFVGTNLDGKTSDLVILQGLSPDYGFIIDPGTGFLDYLFGVRFRTIPCLPFGSDS